MNHDKSKPGQAPRIAILGIHLEANGFAPPTVREDFTSQCWEQGEAITRLARQASSHLPSEVPGFYARMDATGAWLPVPLIMLAAQPGGPIEQPLFDDFLQRAEAGLRAALPLDGVYVCSHGGSSATADDDNDGSLLAMVRRVVGLGVPVIVTHDLHCNVSERLVDAADALIAYRTNPHVDQRERAAEAADLMRGMLGGLRTRKAFIRLPIAAPTVTLLTREGPYADLIQLGQQLTQPPILNVSVTAGCVFTDVSKCGMTVNVTADGDQAAADRVARRIAEAAWADRKRYFRNLTTLPQAVALGRDAGTGKTPPVLLADISDNPGGGGRGNTTWLMRALHEAGVQGAVVGLFADPALARHVHQAGEGASVHAVFNQVESEFSKRFESAATVVKLSDGRDVGRRGMHAGRHIILGPSALLRLEGSGLLVAVVSLREQPLDPRMLEMFGIDLSQVRCLVLKSRGHFRAGFDEFFAPAQIHEVDTPGLTSAVLSNFPWKGLKRPIWPLDAQTTFDLSSAL
jgi:microcystin degradation protein MlrC